jgi:superfamily II DNA or RNA helicase
MRRVDVPNIVTSSLNGAFDSGSYARGVQYLHERAVLRMWWDDTQSELHGTVRGGAGSVYTTTARFSPVDGWRLAFDHGICSCPVAFNCKHVVALILAAAEPAGHGQARETNRVPGWERSLRSLLGPPAGNARRSDSAPLAIELSLSANTRQPQAGYGTGDAQPPALLARLVHPGKNGAWVGGTLSWTKLDSLRYYGDHPDSHVRLLQEIYAVCRSGSTRSAYYSYGYGEEKSVDLAAFESRTLWPMLDEASSIGLRLVQPRKLGDVPGYARAELCLDITGGPAGELVIGPVLRIDGAPPEATLVRFIGTMGHGLVLAERPEAGQAADRGGWRIRLARLDRDVPPELQRMALASQRLEIPAAARSSFSEGFYPRLRQTATLISSDGAFTPPAISGPTLVLHASYRAGHDVEVSWDWAYQVGDARLRAPLYQGQQDETGYRDAAAERDILAQLDLPLDRFGLLLGDQGPAGPGPALAPVTRLAGIDTMRFSTELLPLINGHPWVTTEITGDPADYREAGDTLLIGVSADEVPGETDWFDLGVTITVEGQRVPFADVFVALSRGESHLLLDNGAYFSLQKPELLALARLIGEAQALQDAPAGGARISRFQAGLWQELTELGVVDHQASAWQRQVEGLLSIDAIERPEPAATLRATMRPYQLDGFHWLTFLWRHRLGGILADDMGLGKTLQSLALICHARQGDPGLPPFLIVAPTSVVSNWTAESERFTPGLRVVAITETAARSGLPFDEIAAGADAIVTTYTLLRIDFESYAALPWSGLILDEAQQAKNHQSKIYQCLRRLPVPFKIAITGTPMENNLMELWSLLSITAPGLFPNPVRFRDYYARPIEKQSDAELLGQLQRRIKPLVRRRTKEQVAADLPAKQEQVLEVALHPRHRKAYQTHLQRERQKILGLIDDMNANRFTILRSLTLLRQMSLHAGLVDSEEYGDLPSSKIDALIEQLQAVRAGAHRALVFSQFTGFLDRVRQALEVAGLRYCYLDGKTRDRAAVLESFKNGDAPVFLISLKAGGFGLNLTEADYCFLLDPWWNPATEAQAVDRTHRIGQTRNVMVYRLIAKDTIEEKVMALKERKAELFSSVIDGGGVFSSSLDADDIRGLLA